MPSPHTTSLQDMVFQDKDFFLPFREHSPSRVAVRDHVDSPFRSSVITTRAAFFSALVFRGITQSTAAVRTGNVWFQDLKAFQELAEEHDEGWMCKKNALGFPNKHRSTSNAPALWHASSQHHRFFVDPPLSFTAAFDFILSSKQPRSHIKFFGFGPLTAFLLIVDYAYAGVVANPSFQELGAVLRRIDRGGVRGLRLCSALPGGKDKPSDGDCTVAFKMAYDFLDISLSQEIKDVIRFDVYLSEHTLCKLARLNSRFHLI